ncbi:hypothetical protein DFQ28_010296 [Apophysomyces sp. BC1034]|nr:hypothetical protein DFQ30_005974 [Apophysomyces sp. BC1015]KAG0177383.1 hypothetical protein DFQ29_004903 [Apophysomyces sp. BC1021]KAG0184876.1 hypothetical protein DFQ28_010296 [Apophysomyces sp. BC1034]
MRSQTPAILWWLLAILFSHTSVGVFAESLSTAEILRPRLDQNGITSQISIPASWAIAGNVMSIFQATNACVMLTSPVVGGVYPTSTSLPLGWVYNKTAIDAFRENFKPGNSNVNLTLSLLWVDNYTNKTGLIASNLDPATGYYLWDAPTNIKTSFNKRLYVILKSSWEGLSEEQELGFVENPAAFEFEYGLTCRNHDQIAGPFTLLSQPSRFLFVTGPDPGVMSNNSVMNSLGHGSGFLSKVPMGRFFLGVPIPITWYCTMPDIKTVSLYLVPIDQEHSAQNITLAEHINALSARFYYRALANPSVIPYMRQYRIVLLGYTSANNNTPAVVSWAADGPYTIDNLTKTAV